MIDSAAISTCGDGPRTGTYTLKVDQVLKGEAPATESVKVCGNAPILLSNNYIIAGKTTSTGAIMFEPDSVILFVPLDKYFRPVSYDSPYIDSDRGRAYSAGIELSNFFELHGKKLGLKSYAIDP